MFGGDQKPLGLLAFLAYVFGVVMGVSQHEARLIGQLFDQRRSYLVVCHVGRGEPSRRRKPHPKHELTTPHVLQPYCNRASTHWYTMDKVLPPGRGKPPKQAQFPDAPGRPGTRASKLVMR